MIWGCLEKDPLEVTMENYTIRVSAALFLLRSSSSFSRGRVSEVQNKPTRKGQSTSLMR